MSWCGRKISHILCQNVPYGEKARISPFNTFLIQVNSPKRPKFPQSLLAKQPPFGTNFDPVRVVGYNQQ